MFSSAGLNRRAARIKMRTPWNYAKSNYALSWTGRLALVNELSVTSARACITSHARIFALRVKLESPPYLPGIVIHLLRAVKRSNSAALFEKVVNVRPRVPVEINIAD